MKITFNNCSKEHIELTSGEKKQIIASGSSFDYITDNSSLSFSVNPYEKSFVTYFWRTVGLIRKKNFCTLSHYSTAINKNAVINLHHSSAKGRFSDIYRRVTAVGEEFPVTLERYSVADETDMRKEFARARKRNLRTVFFFELLDILKSGLIVLLLLLIPFALIWIFGSLETAFTVCRNLFIPIFIIIIIFNRIFDGLKKKLWYFLKGKALKNSTYKGTDSHFEDEYIREIF